MTAILSWNIQNGLGVDGILSLARISKTIREMGHFDIICLQEVSSGILLPDGSYADQISELTAEFAGYRPLFGPALEVGSDRGRAELARYGNLILTRHRIQSAFCHPLPQPVDGHIKQMPRQMTEITVKTPSGPLCVMTTHLEFHSQIQRLAQCERIASIADDIAMQAHCSPAFSPNGPYARFERAERCVLCGDFNFLPNSAEYDLIINKTDTSKRFYDAWPKVHSGKTHAPTCGIFDTQQWSQGPHCRDFFFVSKGLSEQIKTVSVNGTTDASDHQPLMMELDD